MEVSAAVTIHFRKPELTARCIESLLADGWPLVLVWDNSEDEGRSIEALRRAYAHESRVLLVENADNLGFGRGMNAALAELGRRGHLGPVLLINNDACVIPGCRTELLQVLDGVPGNALIAPRLLQGGREHGWLHYQPWLALVTQCPLPGSFAYLSGCCLLVHRRDNAAPLFDPDFFMYGEDVELSWRMRRQGESLVLLNDAWVVHEGSASSSHASEAYERFLVSSHWRLTSKLAECGWECWTMRATKLPALLARACFRVLRYHSLRPVRALVEIIRVAP